jgi:hypothetical protein
MFWTFPVGSRDARVFVDRRCILRTNNDLIAGYSAPDLKIIDIINYLPGISRQCRYSRDQGCKTGQIDGRQNYAVSSGNALAFRGILLEYFIYHECRQ